MKKTLMTCLTAAVLSAAAVLPVFASAAHPYASMERYKDSVTLERYTDENGNVPSNEWMQAPEGWGYYRYGGYTWRYFDKDGYPVRNTTIDGKKLNSLGEWYEFCPSAPYVEARPDEWFQPYSYDGKELKNDTIGLCLRYTEEDYAADYEMEISNSQGSSGYGVASIWSPNGVSLGITVGNVIDGKTMFDDSYNSEYGTTSRFDAEICGSRYDGFINEYPIIGTSNAYLYGEHRGRGVWIVIDMPQDTGTAEENRQYINSMIEWLNAHMTLY